MCVSGERLETADYRRVAGAARVVPDETRVEIPSFMLPSCGAGGDHPVSCCAASPPGCGSGGGRNRPRGPIRRPAGAGAAERKRSLRGPIVARRSEGRAIWMNHEVEILRRSRPGRKTKDGTSRRGRRNANPGFAWSDDSKRLRRCHGRCGVAGVWAYRFPSSPRFTLPPVGGWDSQRF